MLVAPLPSVAHCWGERASFLDSYRYTRAAGRCLRSPLFYVSPSLPGT